MYGDELVNRQEMYGVELVNRQEMTVMNSSTAEICRVTGGKKQQNKLIWFSEPVTNQLANIQFFCNG